MFRFDRKDPVEAERMGWRQKEKGIIGSKRVS